jgi:hypothetical protein
MQLLLDFLDPPSPAAVRSFLLLGLIGGFPRI